MAESRDHSAPLLVGSIFVVALCGIIYELVGGTVASYLLGDSVTQYSLVIGVFLSAMGAGAYLSRFVIERTLTTLVATEVAVGLLGGLTGLVAFTAFAISDESDLFLLAWLFGVGTLVGLEVPLVLRLLRRDALRTEVSNLLAADYAGALVASLLFPFVLMPFFGLIRAALLAGMANVAVGLVLSVAMSARLAAYRPGPRVLQGLGGLALIILVALFFVSGALTDRLENELYQDDILLAESSARQRIIVTRYKDDVRLFLNGQLQFSTVDEYRYHESLVHPALAQVAEPKRVLILGGGDGMVARELLRHPAVEHVTLVDLDPSVTTLFADHAFLSTLNDGALRDQRVHVLHDDAFSFIRETNERWDVIIADLPDPSELALGKLYSDVFYKMAFSHLTAGGSFATQATSPYRAKRAYWSIVDTVRTAAPPGATVLPYHIPMPTFGQWGFVLMTRAPAATDALLEDNRFLTPAVFAAAQTFPPDMQLPGHTAVNRLSDPVVVQHYREGYVEYFD